MLNKQFALIARYNGKVSKLKIKKIFANYDSLKKSITEYVRKGIPSAPTISRRYQLLHYDRQYVYRQPGNFQSLANFFRKIEPHFLQTSNYNTKAFTDTYFIMRFHSWQCISTDMFIQRTKTGETEINKLGIWPDILFQKNIF